ncbi:hypothetical protein HNR46_001889 [Haloferula luteola]|uniref:Uncharacterized protein n=1 Tax=Haloferula luteola TaxID=595692 RepID=A0A840VCK8_9BACT|nr:hypothetical protein [Haloferula luteola]MBB5351650.1 hypothetical protein [Haloferula luteola]
MKPTVLLASAAALTAVALVAFKLAPDSTRDGASDDGLTARQLQQDPTDADASSLSKKAALRPSSEPMTDDAIAEMEKTMTGEHRDMFREKRAEFQPTPESEARLQQIVQANRASDKLREQLRSAVLTSPENWAETYADLMGEHRDQFAAQPSGGWDNPGNSQDSTTDPADLSVDLVRAVELKEYYHSIVDPSLPRWYIFKDPNRAQR